MSRRRNLMVIDIAARMISALPALHKRIGVATICFA